MNKKFVIASMLFVGLNLNVNAQNDVVTNQTVIELLRKDLLRKKSLVPLKTVQPEPLHMTSVSCVNLKKQVLMLH
ncbi:MAG: hypothetical protein ACLTOV_06905 [Phocaeicola sp.]